MGTFYVYEHWRSDKNIPFYVGKGRGKRARERTARNQAWKNIVENLELCGHTFEVRFIAYGLSENEAFEIEKDMILFRRKHFELANIVDGGGGVSGYRHPPEVIEKFKATRKGKKKSAEHRARIGAAHRGRQFSDETRARMSAGQKSKAPVSEETRKKLSAAKAGKRHSEIHSKRISEALKGHVISPETREKIGAAQRGVKRGPLSEETKAKMSAAKSAYWKTRKSKHAA